MNDETPLDLTIGILGPLQVIRDGTKIELPRSRKVRALLAYLALQRRPVRREELCDLFWQGAPDPKGELRWSLSKIRGILGNQLETSGAYAQVFSVHGQVDGLTFLELARQAQGEDDVERALRLWRGVPLADADVENQQMFQSWLALTRDSFISARNVMLQDAIDRTWNNPQAALRIARRLVFIEPWSEWGHARVAQLLVLCGRAKEAASYIQSARKSLSQELGLPEKDVLLLPTAPTKPMVITAATPRPQIAKPRIRIEPMRITPQGNRSFAISSKVEGAILAAALRKDCFEMADNHCLSAIRASASNAADFALRGTVSRLGTYYVISLRCVNLRRGIIIWAASSEISQSNFSHFDNWLEQALEALDAQLRHTSLEITDADIKQQKLNNAADLAASLTPCANTQALALLNDILESGDHSADALALAAWCHAQRAVYNWSTTVELDRIEARRLANAAIEHGGGNNPKCLTMSATAQMLIGEHAAAEILLEKALHLDGNAIDIQIRAGWRFNYSAEAHRAMHHFHAVMRQSPADRSYFNAAAGLGAAHFIDGNHPEAIRCMEQAWALNPRAGWILRNLVPAYSAAGEHTKAESGVKRLLDSYPGLTVAEVTNAMVFPSDVLKKIGCGLREAGLPN